MPSLLASFFFLKLIHLSEWGKKTIVSVILLVSINYNCLGGNHHENHKQFEEETVQSHSQDIDLIMVIF